jgi:oligoribonuclease
MASMNIDKHGTSTKLLWVDLEMTGLDPERHVITEVAVEVTDWEFKTLATYEAIIFHPDDVLDQANDWTKEQDLKNGFLDQVRKQGRPEQDVMRELAEFIRTQFGDEPAVLAGNSIHQDRRFIRQWWPDVEALLHYRMLDVSSWKLVMGGKYGVDFQKQEQHRAAADIRESITELQYYLQWLRDPTVQG